MKNIKYYFWLQSSLQRRSSYWSRYDWCVHDGAGDGGFRSRNNSICDHANFRQGILPLLAWRSWRAHRLRVYGTKLIWYSGRIRCILLYFVYDKCADSRFINLIRNYVFCRKSHVLRYLLVLQPFEFKLLETLTYCCVVYLLILYSYHNLILKFQCYDLLGESHLRRETMYQLMKKSLVKASRDDDVEEAVKVRFTYL